LVPRALKDVKRSCGRREKEKTAGNGGEGGCASCPEFACGEGQLFRLAGESGRSERKGKGKDVFRGGGLNERRAEGKGHPKKGGGVLKEEVRKMSC